MATFEGTGPAKNPYGRVRPKADQAPKREEPKKEEFYRFNMKLPAECRAYLQEMAWRNRTTITAYLADLVMADMAAHPEWKDTLDETNAI